MSKKHFEDFDGNQTRDVLERARQVDAYLKQHPEKMLDGLGWVTLGGARPDAVLSDAGETHRVIMMGSNSYLDMTSHPDVLKAAAAALEQYGYGAGAVSLFAGITDLHRELEQTIADFYGAEDAMLFASGYGSNVGILSGLCGEGDVIINDSANHASIFDGSKLSGARLKMFPHGSMRRLEHVLQRLGDAPGGRLIVTDGVFSMHGDLARLDEIASLAQKYEARVMVDDAHGIGVVGPTGRGTAEACGVLDKIDLHAGTLSKAPGGLGGYCAGSRELIQYLRIYSRAYVFATAMPAPVVAGLLEVFRLMKADQAGRKQLWENIRYVRGRVQEAGFVTGPTDSGVIPLVVGDEVRLAAFHRALLRAGLYTNIVSYPAVRRSESRVRLCMMSTHTREQLDRALEIIINAGKECDVIA